MVKVVTIFAGASLLIYNVQFGVVQSRHHFKLFALPPRLWCAGSNLLIAGAHNLLVVPYKLETQQLSALVGAHCSEGTDDSDVQELYYMPCASWVADSTTKDMCCQPNQQVPEAIKEQLATLQANGCCQSVLVYLWITHCYSVMKTNQLSTLRQGLSTVLLSVQYVWPIWAIIKEFSTVKTKV
jgi:hypothetical protein